MSKYITLTAILIGLLIVVAFYVGSTNLAATLFSGGNSILLTLQGRNAQGNFAPYPGNAGLAA